MEEVHLVPGIDLPEKTIRVEIREASLFVMFDTKNYLHGSSRSDIRPSLDSAGNSLSSAGVVRRLPSRSPSVASTYLVPHCPQDLANALSVTAPLWAVDLYPL